MWALFGSPVGHTVIPSFNLGDLCVGASSATISGAAHGVLRRVCLRCVLGLFLRTRGFVGLVLVVTGVAGVPTPSVDAFSLSEVGNVPPFIIVSITFFRSLIAVFLGFLKLLDAFYPLLCYLFVVLLVRQHRQLAVLREQIVRC